MIYVAENSIVVPGQLLADNDRRSGPGTFVRDGRIYSAIMGLFRQADGIVRVIPLSGRYRPQRGDKIVGIVSDIKPMTVEVDIGGDFTAVIKLPEKEVPSLKVDIGDCIFGEIRAAGIRGTVIASEGLQKIPSGILVRINPAKVPRLVGRKGSMIQVLRRESGCDFWVGRNGFVVVNGPDPSSEFAAISAINLIESEAHLPGLTERVINLLRKLRSGVYEQTKAD